MRVRELIRIGFSYDGRVRWTHWQSRRKTNPAERLKIKPESWQ